MHGQKRTGPTRFFALSIIVFTSLIIIYITIITTVIIIILTITVCIAIITLSSSYYIISQPVPEAGYYTSHTKTMLPTWKSVPRSTGQLDHTKTSWPRHSNVHHQDQPTTTYIMVVITDIIIIPHYKQAFTWGKSDDKALVGSLQHVDLGIYENLVVPGVTESCAVVGVVAVDDQCWKVKTKSWKKPMYSFSTSTFTVVRCWCLCPVLWSDHEPRRQWKGHPILQ